MKSTMTEKQHNQNKLRVLRHFHNFIIVVDGDDKSHSIWILVHSLNIPFFSIYFKNITPKASAKVARDY